MTNCRMDGLTSFKEIRQNLMEKFPFMEMMVRLPEMKGRVKNKRIEV